MINFQCTSSISTYTTFCYSRRYMRMQMKIHFIFLEFFIFSVFSMVNNWNTPHEWLWPMVGCNTMVENQDSHLSPVATSPPAEQQRSSIRQPARQRLRMLTSKLNLQEAHPKRAHYVTIPLLCDTWPTMNRLFDSLSLTSKATGRSYGNYKKVPLLSTCWQLVIIFCLCSNKKLYWHLMESGNKYAKL